MKDVVDEREKPEQNLIRGDVEFQVLATSNSIVSCFIVVRKVKFPNFANMF